MFLQHASHNPRSAWVTTTGILAVLVLTAHFLQGYLHLTGSAATLFAFIQGVLIGMILGSGLATLRRGNHPGD